MVPLTGWPPDMRRITTFLPLSVGRNPLDSGFVAFAFSFTGSSFIGLLLRGRGITLSYLNCLDRKLYVSAINHIVNGESR